ncbi:hypothetical protein [Arthrobacter sp.]|uniref:hypothetical protein n=1 Tax=Arthrobacter sp. TaxID=1667 RepID=UPI003A923E60
MDLTAFGALAVSFPGVRGSTGDGPGRWSLHGRLIARQLGDHEVVIRTSFGHRSAMLRDDPGTFSVPRRFEKHMMVLADLEHGDPAAIENAVARAWQLQSEPG